MRKLSKRLIKQLTPAPPPGESWYQVATRLDAELACQRQTADEERSRVAEQLATRQRLIDGLQLCLQEARRRTITLPDGTELNFASVRAASFTLVDQKTEGEAVRLTLDVRGLQIFRPKQAESSSAVAALKTIARIAAENSK